MAEVETALRKLFGNKVLKGDIDKLGGDGKVIGVYMPGRSSPDSKEFTSKLTEQYEEFKEVHKDNFEIIFVSSDKNDSDFMSSFRDYALGCTTFCDMSGKKSMQSENII